MVKTSSSITQKSKSSLVEYSHLITQEIIEIRNRGEGLIFELAKRLKEVRDKQLWKLNSYESFHAYIAQPEMAFDRRTVLYWIQIYETFIEKYARHPDSVAKIGWTKLAKVIPYVNEHNYEYMLELAESNSRSDIDKELVKQHYISKKEYEPENIECPFCHKVFQPIKRKESHYPQEDYNRVIKAYEKAKETKFEGKEYDPIMSVIRTMFFNGRTPEQIIATIEFMANQDEYDWTINTVRNKIAEILPKIEPKEEMTEFERRWKKQ